MILLRLLPLALTTLLWLPRISGFSQKTTSTPSSLTQLTVSQLRQAIQDGGYYERGLFSRLRRKQDLIDFLKQQHQRQDTVHVTLPSAEAVSMPDEESHLAAHDTAVLKGDDDDSQRDELQLDASIEERLPKALQQCLSDQGLRHLLPIQQAAFDRIWRGGDAVLEAPTGQGKTLAVALPLMARQQQQRQSTTRAQAGVATPQVVVLCPSRELARQVGREWQRLSAFKKNKHDVVTVFGGVPVERHVALLKYKPRTVVATPGRLRELVRDGHLSYQHVQTLVLDEADVLLDAQDAPDVQAVLRDLEQSVEMERPDHPEYQLVLVSATLNDHVRTFTQQMEISSRAFISVSDARTTDATVPSHTSPESIPQPSSRSTTTTSAAPVQHWHMSCKSSVRTRVAAHVITAAWRPRLTLVFVPTKSEVEAVAAELSGQGGAVTTTMMLHGDMSQTARSRTVARIRQWASSGDLSSQQHVLVATDVMSRGLDLPHVDLVVQFGIPRMAGKDGTYDSRLYIHRTGRAGRYRVNPAGSGDTSKQQPANALLLWDPAAGEGKLLPQLTAEVEEALGRTIVAKTVPSSLDVINAGYKRAMASISQHHDSAAKELTSYFRSKLEQDLDTSDTDALLDALASCMASAANLDPSLSPTKPHASLLSGDPALRTLRVSKEGSALSPPEVIAFCKELGSGKLGRVTICGDGSAVFDLAVKKADKLVEAAETEEWSVEVPLTLPDIP